MEVNSDLNPKTGLPYKTTLEQRLQARKHYIRMRSDPTLKAKHAQWSYKWRRKPKEMQRRREYMRKHNLSSKRIFEILKYNAIKRSISINFNVIEFTNWWNNNPNNCYYCKREIYSANEFFGKHMGRLSVDRLDNSKGYEIDNIAKACWLCNRIKGNIFTKDEMLEIGKIINTFTRLKHVNKTNE